MTTPLFKKLKNGTTLYVLPGAAEDLSATYQNANIKMTFSKFALVRIPSRRVPGLGDLNAKSVFDIEKRLQDGGAFYQSSNLRVPITWGEAVVESLRNYVANHECTVRATRLNQTDYLYNTDELRTVSERVFWKWLRKNNALSLEPALTNEEWTPTDTKFLPNNVNKEDYLPKYMWRERLVEPYLFAVDGANLVINRNGANIDVVFQRTTNFRPGDYIKFFFLTEGLNDGQTLKVVGVSTSDRPDNSVNDTVSFEWPANVAVPTYLYPTGVNRKEPYVMLDYDRVVQFIGEVTATNNTAGPTNSATEVWAHVPNQTGRTPSIMFDVVADSNYRPNMEYPILPEQYQAEIQGADNPLSAIAANPYNYPGDYFGHFDTDNNTYTTSTGDFSRRNGAYFGIGSGVNVITDIPFTDDATRPLLYPQFDPSEIDGLGINFDLDDYLLAVEDHSFSSFSAASINNRAPEDFEFNAVLWFYDLEDVAGGTREKVTNLYGIQFMDNPDRPEVDFEDVDLIPCIRKQVANGVQDGTAFSLNLRISFQVDSEDSPMAFDPDSTYSLFGMELYSEAMGRLATLTDIYYKTLTQVLAQRSEVDSLRTLVYSQQSIDQLRQKMRNMEELLKLYATLQIGASDSIVPELDAAVSPPRVRLHSVDKRYSEIYKILSTDLYQILELTGDEYKFVVSPLNLSFPSGKDFMVVFTNNDQDVNQYEDPDAPKLQIVLEKDLDYKQSAEFIIQPSVLSKVNKQLELYVNYNDTTAVEPVRLFGPIDLPVATTSNDQRETSSLVTGNPKYSPVAMYLQFRNTTEYNLVLDFDGDLKNLELGSRVFLNNFLMNLNTQTGTTLDLSGQYEIAGHNTAVMYVPGPVEHVELLTTNVASVSSIIAPAGYVNYAKSPYTHESITTVDLADATIGWRLGTNREVVDLHVVQPGRGFSPDDSAAVLEVSLAANSITWEGGNIAPKVKLIPRVRTRVHLKFSNNPTQSAFFPTPATAVAYSMRSITGMLATMPYMDFNKGYRILVTRIDETPDLRPSRKFERYRVSTERL